MIFVEETTVFGGDDGAIRIRRARRAGSSGPGRRFAAFCVVEHGELHGPALDVARFLASERVV